MIKITIENLEIRFRNVSQSTAKSISNQLHDKLVNQFEDQLELVRWEKSSKIDLIDSGTVQIDKNVDKAELAEKIAIKVVDSIIGSNIANRKEG